jgi:hypothetical protein
MQILKSYSQSSPLRNSSEFDIIVLANILNKLKVLIPCEISINTNIHGSYFIYFHIPKFWDVIDYHP